MPTTKYTSNNDLHHSIIFQIVNDVFHSELKNDVAFKGGTLCYFLYNLPRFSVDLDFDYFGKEKDLTSVKEKDLTSVKEKDLTSVKEITKQILLKYGKIIQETKSKLIIKYQEQQRPLKIEYNTRISKNDAYEFVQFFGKTIRVMRKDCILANKMVAQTQRKNKIARRDLFDIYYFLTQGFPVNQALIKEKTGKTYGEYLDHLTVFIQQNFSEKNVLEGLGELVSEKQKHWIRKNLINETISLLALEKFKLSK